jgi:hypothetical protein
MLLSPTKPQRLPPSSPLGRAAAPSQKIWTLRRLVAARIALPSDGQISRKLHAIADALLMDEIETVISLPPMASNHARQKRAYRR